MQPRPSAEIKSCVQAGSTEACKEAFVENEKEGIKAGMKASVTAYKKEAEIELDNGVGIGGKVEMGKVEADASLKLGNEDTQIKFGVGAWLSKVTGEAKIQLGCAEDRCYEISVKASAGIGAQTSFGVGVEKTAKKSSYEVEVGVGPVKSKFVLTMTNKQTGEKKQTDLPEEFSTLMQNSVNKIDPSELEINAKQLFLTLLKKQNIREISDNISEEDLKQIAKEEAEKLMNGESKIHQQFVKNEKAIEDAGKKLSSNSDKYKDAVPGFNDASENLKGLGAMLHLAGNRHASKVFTMGQIVSSIPKVVSTVKKSFDAIGGLLSGKVAISMGSVLNIIPGLGAAAGILSSLNSIFSGADDNDEVMEFLGRIDAKLDVVLQNQVIMDKKLDVINAKADMIFEVVNKIFFTQQLNHKELIELLTDQFSHIRTDVSDAHSLLSRTHTLISEESSELRGMLKEERFAAIQELDEVVNSKLKRKQTAFEHFLDEDFDGLFTKAKIASESNALTGGDRDCQSENRLTQLKDIRRFDLHSDYYSAFNIINFINQCMTSGSSQPKMSNLIGAYILVDTLTKIVNRLVKEKQTIKEFLPELDQQIEYVQKELEKVDKFVDQLDSSELLRQQIIKTKQALQAVQAQTNEDVNAFEETVKQKIKDAFTSLVLGERKAIEQETSWRSNDYYSYPAIWRGPLRMDAVLYHITQIRINVNMEGMWIHTLKNQNWEQMSQNRIPCFRGSGDWCNNDLQVTVMGRVEKQEPNVITDYMSVCKTLGRAWDPYSASPVKFGVGSYLHPSETVFLTKAASNHNSKLFEEIRLVSRWYDFVDEQRKHFSQLHQDHLKSWDQIYSEPSKTLSLEVDGHISALNDKPVLRFMFPENIKGPALPIPHWVDWKQLFPKELYAELLKIGNLSFTYGVKDNVFTFDIHFVYLNNQTKTHLYRFTDQLDKYICEPNIYHAFDKASYYWEGGTYCYKPSIEKLFITGKNIFFQAFDYPAHAHEPGKNKDAMPEGATFIQLPAYDEHLNTLQKTIDTKLIELRTGLNDHITNNILKKNALSQAIENFEFNLRLLHQAFILKASDLETAIFIHEKLLAIAERCDREGILKFTKQYEGNSDYLEHHIQTCIDDLAKVEETLPSLSLKGNDLLSHTHEKTKALKDSVSYEPPIKPDPITDETPTNGVYTAASSSIVLNTFNLVKDIAKFGLDATFSGVKMLRSAAANYVGGLLDSPVEASANVANGGLYSTKQSAKIGKEKQDDRPKDNGTNQSQSRGVMMPADVFRVRPSQPDPVEAKPASLNDNLTLGLVVVNKIKPYLPWCKQVVLTDEDKVFFQEQQKILKEYEAKFPHIQFGRAQSMDMVNGEFHYLSNIKAQIASAQLMISNALKYNKISSSDKSSIMNKMEILKESMPQLQKISRQLRKDMRTECLHERRQMRKKERGVKIATLKHQGIFSVQSRNSTLSLVDNQLLLNNHLSKSNLVDSGCVGHPSHKIGTFLAG